MSLTLGGGPLAGSVAGDVNYAIEGPAHRLLFQPHPRRVRAEVAGRTILDTVRGRLLHETGLLPVFYAPLDDVDADALEPSDHHTHCPYKGEATYWSLELAGRRLDDAAWSYEQPLEDAGRIAGLVSLDHDALEVRIADPREAGAAVGA